MNTWLVLTQQPAPITVRVSERSKPCRKGHNEGRTAHGHCVVCHAANKARYYYGSGHENALGYQRRYRRAKKVAGALLSLE